MTSVTENIGQPVQVITNNDQVDIWKDGDGDFFGCGPQKDDNSSTQFTSIMCAFDAIADYHEKPLEKKIVDEEKKIVEPVKAAPVKHQKAKHMYKQPVVVKKYDEDEYDEYDEDDYYEDKYIKKPSARFK